MPFPPFFPSPPPSPPHATDWKAIPRPPVPLEPASTRTYLVALSGDAGLVDDVARPFCLRPPLGWLDAEIVDIHVRLVPGPESLGGLPPAMTAVLDLQDRPSLLVELVRASEDPSLYTLRRAHDPRPLWVRYGVDRGAVHLQPDQSATFTLQADVLGLSGVAQVSLHVRPWAVTPAP